VRKRTGSRSSERLALPWNDRAVRAGDIVFGAISQRFWAISQHWSKLSIRRLKFGWKDEDLGRSKSCHPGPGRVVVGRSMSCRKIASRTRSGWRWPQRGSVEKLAFELLLLTKKTRDDR
jgi:hypothetical protein